MLPDSTQYCRNAEVDIAEVEKPIDADAGVDADADAEVE